MSFSLLKKTLKTYVTIAAILSCILNLKGMDEQEHTTIKTPNDDKVILMTIKNSLLSIRKITPQKPQSVCNKNISNEAKWAVHILNHYFYSTAMETIDFSFYFDRFTTFNRITKEKYFFTEEFILASIYIDRFIAKLNKLGISPIITNYTIHNIFSTALILADKYLVDKNTKPRIYQSFTFSHPNLQRKLIASFLFIIEFDLSVSAQEWNQYVALAMYNAQESNSTIIKSHIRLEKLHKLT